MWPYSFFQTILNLKPKVFFLADGLKSETKAALAGKGKKGKRKNEAAVKTADEALAVSVTMNFKRYVYDPLKQMKQS